MLTYSCHLICVGDRVIWSQLMEDFVIYLFAVRNKWRSPPEISMVWASSLQHNADNTRVHQLHLVPFDLLHLRSAPVWSPGIQLLTPSSLLLLLPALWLRGPVLAPRGAWGVSIKGLKRRSCTALSKSKYFVWFFFSHYLVSCWFVLVNLCDQPVH